MHNKSIIYDKLVRDKIPEVIRRNGNEAVIEILDDERFKKYLDNKLAEEMNEYLESGNVEELADLVEVVYALLDYYNVSPEQFEKIRNDKAQARGAFKKRLLLKEVVICNED